MKALNRAASALWLAGITLLLRVPCLAAGGSFSNSGGPRQMRVPLVSVYLPSRLGLSERLGVTRLHFNKDVFGSVESFLSPGINGRGEGLRRQDLSRGELSVTLPASALSRSADVFAGRGFAGFTPVGPGNPRPDLQAAPWVRPAPSASSLGEVPPLEREALILSAKAKALALPLEAASDLSRRRSEEAQALGRAIWNIVTGSAEAGAGGAVLGPAIGAAETYAGSDAAFGSLLNLAGGGPGPGIALLGLSRRGEDSAARDRNSAGVVGMEGVRPFPRGSGGDLLRKGELPEGVPLIVMRVFEQSLVLSYRSAAEFLRPPALSKPLTGSGRGAGMSLGAARKIAEAAAEAVARGGSLQEDGSRESRREFHAFHEVLGDNFISRKGLAATPVEGSPRSPYAERGFDAFARGASVSLALSLLSFIGAFLALRESRS